MSPSTWSLQRSRRHALRAPPLDNGDSLEDLVDQGLQELKQLEIDSLICEQLQLPSDPSQIPQAWDGRCDRLERFQPRGWNTSVSSVSVARQLELGDEDAEAMGLQQRLCLSRGSSTSAATWSTTDGAPPVAIATERAARADNDLDDRLSSRSWMLKRPPNGRQTSSSDCWSPAVGAALKDRRGSASWAAEGASTNDHAAFYALGERNLVADRLIEAGLQQVSRARWPGICFA